MQQAMSGAWPSPPASAPAQSTIRPTLRGLIDRFGPALLEDSGRLKGLLSDECPYEKREISVLLQALAHDVPQDLLRVRSGEPIQSLSPRLVKRLTDEQAMAPEASAWAVQTWAYGLGLGDAAASVSPAPTDRVPPAQTVPAFGSAVNDTGVRTPSPVAPVASGRAAEDWASPARLAGAVVAAVFAIVVAWFVAYQPKLDVVGVQTQGSFVGNGRPVKLLVDVDSRRTHVRNIDVRFLRGDGEWNPSSWSFPVSGDGASGRLEGATLSYATRKPMRATFEFVAVAADGTRSAPFERTFDIVAPVVLESVTLARPAQVGQDLLFDLKYRKGAAEITQIERRVVEGSTTWSQNESVTQTRLDQASGSVGVRADAITAPSNFTMEFVLVDAQGVRSDPQRVTVDVTSRPLAARGTGPGTVVGVTTYQTGGGSTGLLPPGASTAVGIGTGVYVGSKLARGSRGRGAAMVAAGVMGGVFGLGLEGQPRPVTRSTAVEVRLDDGSVRRIALTGGSPFVRGDRVMVSSNGTLSRL